MGMLDDNSYKKDKKIDSDLRNTNYPQALSDIYDFIEKKYENEIESRKNS